MLKRLSSNISRITGITLTILVVLTLANQAMAGELSSTISFSSEELKFTALQEYDYVSMLPHDLINEVGKPNLPARNVYIAVPAEAKVIEVRVTGSQYEDLPGYYNIYPAQPYIHTTFSGNTEFIPPDSSVYNSSTPYPGKLLEYTGIGCLGGQKLVSIRVYPVQYMPKEGRLRFYTNIEFTIHYDLSGTTPLPVNRRSKKASYLYKQMLGKIVLNHQDIQTPRCPTPDSTFEYLIITDDEYVPIFEQLANWKTRKGIPAQIRTVSWITANYSGWDDAEKIRNYLKEAYADSGLIWVLLGGDTDKVPYRDAFVRADDAGGETDYAPCDLYFSDLDGTWDANDNHIYGELPDNVDMYPDVFVSRAPVNTSTEAQTFVSKVLTYEKNPPIENYPLSMLFMAYDADPQTQCEVCKEVIDSIYVPPRFDPITKLYDGNGGWGCDNAINALNDGYNIINHIDHADWNWMGVGDFHHGARLYLSDMDAFANGNRQSILYSVGCFAAAFDCNAVSKHFVNNPNGGGVAFIGNSRYGWYWPGNPESGPSELYDKMFFQSLFWDNVYKIGFTNANAKVYYIGSCQSYNAMRWCQFVLNVLGPTEMPIWTDVPGTLYVDHPSLIPPGSSEFIVTVTSEGAPVESALVCIMDSTVYEYEYTNANGQVVLFVSSPIPGDTIRVTVTHHNYLPYEGCALVLSQGPYVYYLKHSINDTTYGNGDGVVNPGESIEMPLWIKNYGNVAADGVSGVLTTADPYISDISDSVKSFGHIEPGDSAFTGSDGYNFTVLNNCPNAHWITFDLICTDALDSTWISHPSVIVAAPVLSYIGYSVNDSATGNGNGVPEPGETVDMTVSLTNSGLATAEGVHAILSTDDPFIAINLDSTSFGNIEARDTVTSTPYNIYIDPLCPDIHYPVFALEITGNNYTTVDSFSIFTGIPGFFDDVENSDAGWTHYAVTTGYHDEWHISQTRSHSSTHSWKCGGIGSGNYMNYDDAGLVTPPIIFAPNSCLRFWHWIDAEAYTVGAWDGAIVEISSDGGNTWQQITPVGGYPDTIYPGGSGPFPDDTPCFSGSHDWQQAEFYLPEYTGVVHFRFRFGSDGYVTREGWYIDDVSVSPLSVQAIEGTVTEAEKGPIEGAIVTVQSFFSFCDTTDAIGHYFIEVYPDTYAITVTASGYNQFDTTGIVVLPGETTEVNLALTYPELTVEPANFEVGLYPDSTLDTLLYITNNGNGPLGFNLEVIIGGKKAVLHRATLPVKDRVKSDACPASFCRTPADWVPEPAASLDTGVIIESHPSVGSPSGFEWDGTYFWQGNWDGNVVKLDSDFNLIAEYTACGNPDMPPTGLAWHNGYLYQGCYTENNVYKIDVSDGYNPVDTINVPGDGGLLGIEWVGDHLWVTDDNTELIYECDSLGNMINSWTSPDPAPYGISYNTYLDIIYLNGWTGGNIYSIDPHTGEINFAFPTPGTGGSHGCAGSSFDDRYPLYLWIAHQSDGMLYLTDTGNEWWVSAMPTSGTVPAGETFEITIHFDTYGLILDSTYTTSILIHNNSIDSLVDIPVTLYTGIMGVEETASIPKVFALAQNSPNPFRERTVISYQLPGNGKGAIDDLRLTIYDLSGRVVKTLVNGIQNPGYYSVKWDGCDDNGRKLASGIYFYRLEAHTGPGTGDYIRTKKLIILQ